MSPATWADPGAPGPGPAAVRPRSEHRRSSLPEIGRDLGFPGQTQQRVERLRRLRRRLHRCSARAGGSICWAGAGCSVLAPRAVRGVVPWPAASPQPRRSSSWPVRAGHRRVSLLLPSTLSLINTLFEEGPRPAPRGLGGAGASGLTFGASRGVLTEHPGWVSRSLRAPFSEASLPRSARVRRSSAPRLHCAPYVRPPGSLSVTGGATRWCSRSSKVPERGWDAPSARGLPAVVRLSFFAVIESARRSACAASALRTEPTADARTFLQMAMFGVPVLPHRADAERARYSAPQTGLGFLIPSLSRSPPVPSSERFVGRRGTRATLVIGFGISDRHGRPRVRLRRRRGLRLAGARPGRLRCRTGHRLDRDVDRRLRRAPPRRSQGVANGSLHRPEHRQRHRPCGLHRGRRHRHGRQGR
ncbi:hypothetical protein LT493_44095 [Streptomyces tricolor]|nr:hypothetical protein [Streptomyces tricolor]